MLHPVILEEYQLQLGLYWHPGELGLQILGQTMGVETLEVEVLAAVFLLSG